MSQQRPQIPAEATKHYTGLDGLRGAAALLVFLSHSSASELHLLGPDFKGIGKCGVAIFFILSAHLLTLQFMQKNRMECWNTPNLKHYFIRRFTRIYPLYFVYLSTAAVTTWLSEAVLKMKNPDGIPLTIDFAAWVQHLVLMRGDGVTWSIAVEFKYYFFLPLVAWLLHLMAHKGRVSQILLLITAIFASAVIWSPLNLDGNDPRLRMYLSIFLTGSFCGLLGSHWERLPDCKYRVLAPLCLCGLAFLALTTPPLIKTFGLVNPETHKPEQWMFAQGIAFIPVLFSAAYGNGLTSRIFSNRFLRFSGMISFSLYLWHPVFIRGGARLLKGVDPHLVGWLALLGTLVASYVSYRLIEKPFLKVGGKPKAARATAAVPQAAD